MNAAVTIRDAMGATIDHRLLDIDSPDFNHLLLNLNHQEARETIMDRQCLIAGEKLFKVTRHHERLIRVTIQPEIK